MCVRYANFKSLEEEDLRRDAALESSEKIKMPGDLYPGELGEFVVAGGEVRAGRWGLQPAWAKDPQFGRKNAYNARAETIAEKPTFRSAFRHRRCVVPAATFYERAEGRWLRVMPKMGEGFLIAGLYEGGEEDSYTMVTTEPNLAIVDLHDRMPVLLAASDADAWTDPQADLRRLHALLVPCPPEWTRVEDAGPVGGRRKSGEANLFEA